MSLPFAYQRPEDEARRCSACDDVVDDDLPFRSHLALEHPEVDLPRRGPPTPNREPAVGHETLLYRIATPDEVEARAEARERFEAETGHEPTAVLADRGPRRWRVACIGEVVQR